jgi:hypothetical protein
VCLEIKIVAIHSFFHLNSHTQTASVSTVGIGLEFTLCFVFILIVFLLLLLSDAKISGEIGLETG